MSIGVAQVVVNPEPLVNGGSGNTHTVTATVAAGSRLLCLTQLLANLTLTNVTDDQGGSVAGGQWTILDQIAGAISIASASRTATSAGSITVTFTFSGSGSWRGSALMEITGATTGAPIAHAAQAQNGLGTGTDVITSGNMTIPGGTGPCLVAGFIFNFNAGQTSTAGTGFTGPTQYWVAGGEALRPEWRRVTSTGTFAVTGTPSAGSDWRTLGAIFEEAGGGGITGTGSAAMQPFGASGSGAESFSGTGSAAAQPFGASGSGGETFSGSGTAAAKSFGATGTGAETFTSSGSAAAQPFGASGAGTVGNAFIGSGSAAASPFAAAGSGAETFTGTASAALRSFGAAGAGTVNANITGSGSAAASRFGATGSGFTGAAETPLAPPLSTWVDSVTLTVFVDSVRLSLGERVKDRMTTDTYPITNTLLSNGVPVNLAGYTVTINIWPQDLSAAKRANGACTITDAANGKVSYTPSSGDVDTAGGYWVQWKAVSPGGTPYHFPQDGYEPLQINLALG